VLHAVCWKCRTQKLPKNRHLGTIAQICRAISSQLRHVSTLGTEVGLGPDDSVLDGDPAPPSPNPRPQFSSHVCCGQTAGWIKMALSMEVGLRPGHIVLDGDPAPLPKRGHSPSVFGSFLDGCIKMPLNWYGGRPYPRRLCVRFGHCPLPKKGRDGN